MTERKKRSAEDGAKTHVKSKDKYRTQDNGQIEAARKLPG